MWYKAVSWLLPIVFLIQPVGADAPDMSPVVAQDADFPAPHRIDPQAYTVRSAQDISRLSELGDGILVLHFWQSNCAPCLVELPELAAFMDSDGYAALEDRDMRILAISHDVDVGTARRFLVRYAPRLLPARIEPRWTLAKALFGRGGQLPPMPVSFAIDIASGAVLVEKIGPMDWNGEEFENFRNAATNIRTRIHAEDSR